MSSRPSVHSAIHSPFVDVAFQTPKYEKEVKTPERMESDGAIREGGAPNLWSKDCFGLVVNNIAVGWIHGMISRTNYPVFNNYLHMDGYQLMAAFTLINFPFSIKTFIGIFSDSFPINGYRRKPYMNIGWFLCGICLVTIACIPMTEPYYVPGTKIVNNSDSASHALKYIVLLIFATFGLVIAIVADDGLMVEYAQREPEAIRGKIQTTVYFLRMMSGSLAFLVTGFVFNGKQYGGSYSWSLTFNHVMAIAAVGSFITIPFATYFLKEQRVEREPFRKRCGEMWNIIQQRAIWQVMGFFFISGIFGGFGCSPQGIVQREWARVEPLNETIFAVIGSCIFSFSLLMTRKYFLNTNWRWMILITSLVVILIDSIVSLLTIYNVVRSQWFWLGVPILERIPAGMNFIVSSYVVVEIAAVGYESATYGLITTVKDLSGPFSSSLSKNVDAYFDAFATDIETDTMHVRHQVMYCFLIMYIMHLLGNVFLFILPKQKQEAQELRLKGEKSRLAGTIAIVLFIFAFFWSIITNILSILPETACLKVAGGPGC